MTLIPGQVLKCYVKSKLVWHYGIYSGGENVIDMAPRKGVAERHISEFSEGCEIKVEPVSQNDMPLEQVLYRAKQELGKRRYDPLFSNCEHFVNYCRKGKKSSSQVNYFMIGFVLFCVVLGLIFGETSKKSRLRLR